MTKHFTITLMALALLVGCRENTIEPDLFGSLTGEVIFDESGLPAEGVIISTTPATSSFLTLADGTFEYESIKVGSYSVRAELEGYLTAIESVTISENQSSSIVLKLKESDALNEPPTAAHSPTPSLAASEVPISVKLMWEASDPDGDDLTYDVYFFDSNQPQNNLVGEDVTSNSFLMDDLRYGTTYYWQVATKDGIADPVFSEVWDFTTEPFPDHPFVFSKINNGVYEIYSGAVANEFYQLTSGGSNYRPRFSPVGNRIAFINSNFPEKRLFVMDRDGSDMTSIPTPYPIEGAYDFELDFTWSPDGTQLLYMRGKRLYKINIDGTGSELFAELNDDEFIEVDWAGNKVAARTAGDFPYESRILLYNSGGDFLEELVPDLPGSIGGPVFSIDGNSILFTRDTSGFESPDGRQLESHIFLMNINSGATVDLSKDKPMGFNDLDPRFSPNGALVVFTHTSNFPNSQKDVYIMNMQGEGRQKLFENSEMPDWWD